MNLINQILILSIVAYNTLASPNEDDISSKNILTIGEVDYEITKDYQTGKVYMFNNNHAFIPLDDSQLSDSIFWKHIDRYLKSDRLAAAVYVRHERHLLLETTPPRLERRLSRSNSRNSINTGAARSYYRTNSLIEENFNNENIDYADSPIDGKRHPPKPFGQKNVYDFGGTVFIDAPFPQLGSGQSAQVSKVQHQKTGHEYALKYYFKSAPDAEFWNEVRLLKKASRLVAFLWVSEVAKQRPISRLPPWMRGKVQQDDDNSSDALKRQPVQRLIVQTLVRGERMDRYIEKNPKQAKAIKSRFFDALREFHSKTGFTHNDAKPDNAFLTDDGRIEFVDFGQARDMSGMSSEERKLAIKKDIDESNAKYDMFFRNDDDYY